jgi:hypothetical protein
MLGARLFVSKIGKPFRFFRNTVPHLKKKAKEPILNIIHESSRSANMLTKEGGPLQRKD